jgi:hypothetical protein
MATKTTLQEFEAVFPKLEAVLVEHAERYKLPKKELEWYKLVSFVSPRRPFSGFAHNGPPPYQAMRQCATDSI